MLAAAVLALVSAAAPAEKLIVVRASSWTQTTGTLHRFERDAGGRWRAAAAAVPVVLGRAGLGWGRGEPLEPPPDAPRKVEGDLRTPAGIFRLTAAMGYDPAPPPGTTVPYTQATPTWRCVDDPASAHYNTLVDEAAVAKDWSSAEELRRSDESYRRIVVIAHNTDPAVPRGGSCIFLHVRRGPSAPTAGCVGMARAPLESLMGWIDAATRIVILPDPVYPAIAAARGLPPLPRR